MTRSMKAVRLVAAALLLAGVGVGVSVGTDERSPAEVVTGVWLGRSHCEAVEGAPACVDGEVRCEFRMVETPQGERVRLEMRGTGRDGGAEPELETIDLGYEPERWSWTAEVRDGDFRGRWNWRIFEFILHGTLTDLESDRVVRRISVEREASPARGTAP